MKMRHLLAASVAFLVASGAQAEIVLDTSLPLVNGMYGAGTAVTERNATGTVTTVSGPGGNANRANAPIQPGQWLQRNVGGNAAVGITTSYARSGNGSAFFVGTNGNAKADLEYYFESAVPLSQVNSLAYDWLRISLSNNSAAQVPSLRLAVSNNHQNTYLIFEPVYNGVSPPPVDAWQTSMITRSSTFWSNNAALTRPANVAACPDCFASLSDWQAANPDALVYGLSTGIGSGWNGLFIGAVDNVSFDFGSSGANSFNFEVATAAVPEPATWAMMIGGFGLVGGAMRRRSQQAVLA